MHGADGMVSAPTNIGDARNAIVRVDRLSKRYGRTLALDEVSFDIRANELFALLGPNGAGKTTLIHIPVSYTHLTLPTN